MNLPMPPADRYPRYHSELRLFIASTSPDIAPERGELLRRVIPAFRKRTDERGVILIERDLRWEMASTPGRAREILAERMNELHGYRPLFIGILGDGDAGRRAAGPKNLPWLQEPSSEHQRALAMEIIDRVLESRIMRGRAFFYLLDPPAGAAGEGSPEPSRELAALRERIRTSPFIVREGIAGIEPLGNLILEDLLNALDQIHPPTRTLSPLEEARRPHQLFATRLRRAYEEIQSYYDRLDRHIAEGGGSLFITGRSGDGKSALVANWIAYRRAEHPGTPIICHHVGAASVHSDHGTVLRHLMAELRELGGISEPLPETAEGLAAAFPSWLEQVRDERLVLIIDGLDQLLPGSQGLEWLPADTHLPSNVRLIATTTHEGEHGRALFERLVDRDWEELRVQPLTTRQQQSIIARLVAETGGEIGPELFKRFTLGGDSSIPLFLRMGAMQIRNSRNEKERNELLDAGTGEELLRRMFGQLEERFGEPLMRDALSLIWGARAGLRAAELLRLTGGDPDLLSEFLELDGHYLVEQDGLWTFPHKRIREAVELRYLPDEGARRSLHRRLAGYFAAEPATPRRADEEPWQWEQAGNREELARSLADIPMFLCLSEEDRRHELRGYWVRLNDEALLIQSYAGSFAAWRADAPAGEQAGVAERLGTFFTASGLLAPAEEYLRLALRLFGESSGEGHPDTAHAMHMLAELLRNAGEFTEAERLYHEALAIREEQPEPDEAAIAQTVSDIALLYRDSGRHRSALPYYQRALDLKERIHGADHPATAELLNDLALFHQDLHELETTISLYRRSLDIRERRLGPAHPAVATTLNNLAAAFQSSGDLDAAETHYRRALDTRERMLGPNHPNTLITVGNLASLLHIRGEFEAADLLFKRAISSTKDHLGEDHPNMIPLNISYANLLRDSGEYGAAEELLRRTLELGLRTPGGAHPRIGECYNNLAGILRRMDREREAAPLYEAAIDTWRASFGPEHPYISSALYSLAIVRIRQRELPAGAIHLADALAIQEKYYGPDDAFTLEIKGLLARLRRGEFDPA